jgi:signal transduction histidine kinase/ActR/RegA family two-component response regulator
MRSSEIEATVEELRARLAEAEETLRAIRAGEVDAVIVQGEAGEQIYTLRSADHPYRDLVEQMREGAAILTIEGDIVYCNRRLAELVNLPLEQVIGGPIDRFISVADGDSFKTLGRTPSGTYEGRLLAQGGRLVNVYFSLTNTVSDGVERRGLLVADLSELLDARADRDRAEQANRAKDEFIAMLAHELRNPIGAIAGAIQVLDVVGTDQAPAVRARVIITRQVQHLARLLEDLLDVGRLATGKIVLARQPIDLADLVRRSVAVLGGDGRLDRHVEVTTAPVWIDADPTRIEQIVGNLVGNAIKYTQPGGRIRVTVRLDGRDALLTVQDDGCGIPTELLPRIFDLFVQGDQTLDRSRGGLGIGLTLVSRLVELHKGTVIASSDGPGRGSTFAVRLAAIAAPQQESPEGQPTHEVARRRVLVVEDNKDTREMYSTVLQLAGHEVLEAGNADRGLELLKSQRPDVALIDIGLPGLDGYELARRFRADPNARRVLLVALTGYGSQDDRERSRQAGFDHHMVKPVSPETLRELLRGMSGKPDQS